MIILYELKRNFSLILLLPNCFHGLMYFLLISRLASTPAMFNSTLTKDEAFLCPADGSIMITGTL